MFTRVTSSVIIITFVFVFFCPPSILAAKRNMPEMFSPITAQNDSSSTENRPSGLPEILESKQFFKPSTEIKFNEAISLGVTAAQNAVKSQIIQKHPGKTIIVPDDFASIQLAINAASKGDIVRVKPGIYYEQLYIKNGIFLTSASSSKESLPVSVEGAQIKMPARTLKTIIDGSKSQPSPKGMLDFAEGAGKSTVVDGFTIQNLPHQNHHIPGHAHAVNLRGSSPVIMNCIVQNNGSTGIGSHVVYHDQDNEIDNRDFRKDNIKFQAAALLYRNIIRGNLGRGIGCNHFATPTIAGNEIMHNDDSELGPPGPGIGIKHGASPIVIGNIVHHNTGGGILAMFGADQGINPLIEPPSPQITHNIVYENGFQRPAISCQQSGKENIPVLISNNYVSGFGGIGIGIGKQSYGIIRENFVTTGKFAGIAVNSGTALDIRENTVSNATRAFIFINQAVVRQLSGNRLYRTRDQPFLVQDSIVEGLNL